MVSDFENPWYSATGWSPQQEAQGKDLGVNDFMRNDQYVECQKLLPEMMLPAV